MDFDFTAAPAPAATEPLALDGFDFGAPAEVPAEATEVPAEATEAAAEPAAGALDMMAGFQTEEVTTKEEVCWKFCLRAFERRRCESVPT